MKAREYAGGRYAHHGSTGLTGNSESPIRVQYMGGGMVYEQPLTAAMAVVRGNATVIDATGAPISTTIAVICRRSCNGTPIPSRVGAAVNVIDPSPEHPLFVLPWSTLQTPMIAKESCRAVKRCEDAGKECGNCCNNR